MENISIVKIQIKEIYNLQKAMTFQRENCSCMFYKHIRSAKNKALDKLHVPWYNDCLNDT